MESRDEARDDGPVARVRAERAQGEEARPVVVGVYVAEDCFADDLGFALAAGQRFERHARDDRVVLGCARKEDEHRLAPRHLDAALERLVVQKLARVCRGV